MILPPADANDVPTSEIMDPAAQKLGLEVEELRAKLGWDRWIGHIIALVSCLVLVLGAWSGVQQHRAGRALEFERRYWEKQLDVYSRLSYLGTNVALSSGDSIAVKLLAFKELYYGEFFLVADPIAQASAMNFVQRAAGYRGDDVDQDSLLSDAAGMAQVFREALSQSAISPLKPRTTRQ